jgi:hypothetical protein
MKQKIAKFLLFVYLNHIKEDWDEYTNLGKKLIYPAWFIRSIFVWIFCLFIIPEYLFKQSKTYQVFEKFQKLTPVQMKEMQRMQKNNFLNKRYGRGK